MDFYKDFPERSDAGTATTPDGAVVAGADKLNDNDFTMVGANGTGSNSQGKGYKVKLSSIYNYLKGKLLGDSGMEATSSKRGLMSAGDKTSITRLGVRIHKPNGDGMFVTDPAYGLTLQFARLKDDPDAVCVFISHISDTVSNYTVLYKRRINIGATNTVGTCIFNNDAGENITANIELTQIQIHRYATT